MPSPDIHSLIVLSCRFLSRGSVLFLTWVCSGPSCTLNDAPVPEDTEQESSIQIFTGLYLQPSWISVSTPEAGLEGVLSFASGLFSLGQLYASLTFWRQSLLPREKILLKWKHCWHTVLPAPPSASSTPRSTDPDFPVYPAFSEKILSSSWEIRRTE